MKPVSTSKQATLGKFDFTKKIETARGNCFKVQLEDFVTEFEKKTNGITCPFCGESNFFTSSQYLNNHIKYKHPDKEAIENVKESFVWAVLPQSPVVYQAKKDGINVEFPKQNSPAKETRKAKLSSKRRS